MKILVYTCIVCRRDSLPDLQAPLPELDFVCYTDEPERCVAQGWHSVELYRRQASPIMTCRWHKMHPHVHSPEYDFYIWLDGHIVPRKSLYDLMDVMGGAEIAAFHHLRRSDPYQEAEFILDRGLAPSSACEEAATLLRKTAYPENGGLHETSILLMRNEARVRDMLNEWWTTLDRSDGTRDQLHFDRLVRNHKLVLFEPPGEPRENPYFDWTTHGRFSSETRRLQEQWKTVSK